jgi:peptidyl-prolyl cis-trans isomerase C
MAQSQRRLRAQLFSRDALTSLMIAAAVCAAFAQLWPSVTTAQQRIATQSALPRADGGVPLLPWQIAQQTQDLSGVVSVQALASPTTAVAQGRGVTITAAELVDRVRDANEFEQRQFASDPALIDQLADRLVSDRLLAQEARRRGLENDPAVRAATERALIARLRATAITPGADAARVTDEEARAFYAANAYRFHIPERRKIIAIFVTDRTAMDREMRRWRRMNRQQIRRAFRAMAESLNTDEELIRNRHEIVDVTESRDDLDPALRQATFALRDEGEFTPEPIAGRLGRTRGFWMVRLLDRRQAVDRSFEESVEWIRQRLALEHRLRAEREMVLRLSEQAGVRRVSAATVVRVTVSDAGSIDAAM